MRIIEPRNNRKANKTVARKKNYLRPLVTVSVLTVISLLFLSLANHYKKVALDSMQQEATLSTRTSINPEKVAGTNDTKLKYFTGEQFQQLAESLSYPNTHPIDYLPKITGSEPADNRIRTIAESRGYLLRRTPVLPIVKTGEPDLDDDDLLQPKAYLSWQSLKTDAKKDLIPLKLSSGYRSIERQRQLFNSRLKAAGVDVSKISSGIMDDRIVSVLSSTAPPGYSRHHSGYAMDLICDDGTGRSFKLTKCFSWLKKNNYEKAKENGLAPSYPDGTGQQGPEPEPWEYVWVGIASVTE